MKRRFCSYKCHLYSGGALRAGHAAAEVRRLKYGAKKDANHNSIVSALEAAGIAVVDVSSMGYGFPDLIVCRRGITLLVEIKNPLTPYGRRGMNQKQKDWAASWPQPVFILKSLDDVALFANCKDDSLTLGWRMAQQEQAVAAALGEKAMR